MSDSRDMLRSEDDLLAEIGAGLTVEPSTGFREGVQRRVALAASRARFFGAGRQVVGLAAGVLVAVTLVMQFGTAGSMPVFEAKPTPVDAVATRVAESPARASIVADAPAVPAGVVASPARRGRTVARPGQASGVALPESREVRPAGPDLTVLTNQPALLRRLWAGRPPGVAESIGTDAVASRPGTDLEAQIAITELMIAPIVVPEMTSQGAPPASGAGSGGVRRMISAEQSARSRE